MTAVRPKRLRPRLHYELLACGWSGHELLGLDARELRPVDAVFAREHDGVRWHRCLRCDSWLPLEAPATPVNEHPPERAEVVLPLRGKALRDKLVLRLIALDRAFHFVLLATIAAAIFVFAAHRAQLRSTLYRVLSDLHGGVGGTAYAKHGFLHELDRLFSLQSNQLDLVGAAVLTYALLEGTEAIGLWQQRRWAEYLTFVATTVFLPLEVYELTGTVSVLKALTFVINVVVVVYLLFAKRLFGLRGGGVADRTERERDLGWDALERSGPPIPAPAPAALPAS